MSYGQKNKSKGTKSEKKELTFTGSLLHTTTPEEILEKEKEKLTTVQQPKTPGKNYIDYLLGIGEYNGPRKKATEEKLAQPGEIDRRITYPGSSRENAIRWKYNNPKYAGANAGTEAQRMADKLSQPEASPYDKWRAAPQDKKQQTFQELTSLTNARKWINAHPNNNWDTLAEDREHWQSEYNKNNDYITKADTSEEDARNAIRSNQIRNSLSIYKGILERPDDYNDYADDYDRELYDAYYGAGEYDKNYNSLQSTSQSREMVRAQLRELWNEVDSGRVKDLYDITSGLWRDESKIDQAESEMRYAEKRLGEVAYEEELQQKYNELIGQYGSETAAFNPELDRGGVGYSSVAELENGKRTNDVHLIYSLINGGKELGAWGGSNPFLTNEYSYALLMTDGSEGSIDEIGIFNSLYEKAIREGREPTEAKAFLEGLQQALESRYSEFNTLYVANTANTLPFTSSVMSTLMRQTNKYLTIPRVVAGWLGDESIKDPNSWWNRPTEDADTIVQTVSEKIGDPFWSKAYQQGMNSINDVLTGLTATGKTQMVQTITSLFGFGLQVYNEALSRNVKSMDYGKAQEVALADTVNEVAQELLPMEAMLGAENASLIKGVFFNGIANAAQEYFGATVGDRFKEILTGVSEERDRVDELFHDRYYYDDDGNPVLLSDDDKEAYLEARAKAAQENQQERIESTLAGFVGGTLGEGYAVAAKATGTARTGAAINKSENTSNGQTGVNQLVKVAAGMKNTMSQKLAQGIQSKLDQGKTPSNYQVGKLATQMVEETAEEHQDVVKTTMTNIIRNDLRQGGMSESETGEVAAAISRSITEGKVSDEDRTTIAQSPISIGVWKDYNTNTEKIKNAAKEVAKATEPQRSVIDLVGDLTSRTAKGTGVLAEDIDAANRESDSNEEAVDNLQTRLNGIISERFANAAKTALQTTKTLQKSKTFLNDIVQIRLAAYSMRTAMPKTNLDSQTAQTLWDEAKAEFQEEEENRVVRQAKVTPGKGTATYNGASYGTGGWAQAVNGDKTLNGRQKLYMHTVAEITRRMGMAVNFINESGVKSGVNMEDVYGSEDQATGAVTVNIAGLDNNRMTHNAVVTVAHEFTHWLEQNSRNGYAALRQFVFDELRLQGTDVEAELIRSINIQNSVLGAESGESLDLYGAVAEVVARASEGLFTSAEMRNRLAEQDEGLYNKVKNFVRQFVARLNAAIKGIDSSLSREARTLKAKVDEIAKLWLEGYEEALNRGEEGAEATEGERFSTARRELQETASRAAVEHPAVDVDNDNSLITVWGKNVSNAAKTVARYSVANNKTIRTLKMMADERILNDQDEMKKILSKYNIKTGSGKMAEPSAMDYAGIVSKKDLQNLQRLQADAERWEQRKGEYDSIDENDPVAKYMAAWNNADIEAMQNILDQTMLSTPGVIPFKAAGWYNGDAHYSYYANAIKERDPAAIMVAAAEMAEFVPDNAVLVPIPNRNGQVTENTDTMLLARAISELTGAPVVNALTGQERMSRKEAKGKGIKQTAEDLGFRKAAEIPEGTVPYFIDNVVGSGVTAKAAHDAFGTGITLAYAKSTRAAIDGLKRSQNEIYGKGPMQFVRPLDQRADLSMTGPGGVRYSTAKKEELRHQNFEHMKEFRQQLEDFMANQDAWKRNNEFVVGKTPILLQKMGLTILPVTINKDHVAHALFGTYNRKTNYRDDHIIDINEFSKLQQKLNKPIAIIKSNRPGKIVAFLDMKAKSGKTVVVPMEINTESTLEGERFDSIHIATVHRNIDVTKQLAAVVDDYVDGASGERLFYLDSNKYRKMLKALQGELGAGIHRSGSELPNGLIKSLNESTTDVKPKYTNQTETRNFKKWFKDSVIVNEDGSPKIMYHGTLHGGFEEFGGRNNFWYFSDSKDYAKTFAGRNRNNTFAKGVRDGILNGDYTSQIYEVYLSVQNPFITEDQSIVEDALYWDPSLVDELKEKGYDGLMLKDMSQVIAFDKNQIKSATDNIGTFDARTDNINYSVAQRDQEYMDAVNSDNMETAQRMVDEQAEEMFSGSKVRGANGKLLKVYHGTQADFTVFDTSISGGKNGTQEGFGIYLSDEQKITKQYGDRQIGAYLNMQKPAYGFKKTLKKAELVKLIRQTCENEAKQMLAEDDSYKYEDALRDTWVSNWVYTHDYSSMQAVYSDVAQQILNNNDSDADMIYEIMESIGIRTYDRAMDFYHDTLTPVTGIDGFWQKWDNHETGGKSNVFVAFDSAQIKEADPATYDDNGDVIPLSQRFNQDNKDIRWSVSQREQVYKSLNIDPTVYFTGTMEQIEAAEKAEDARAEEFRKLINDNKFMALEFVKPDGRSEILHASTRPGIKWQLSYIGSDGVPSVHENYGLLIPGKAGGQAVHTEEELYRHLVAENLRSDLRFNVMEDSAGESMTEQEANETLAKSGEIAYEPARYSFAGFSAAGVYGSDARRARQMAAKGATEEEIREATGSIKGYNGRWWRILDNNDMHLKYGLDMFKEGDPYLLPSIYDAEELYKAYPQLRKAWVYFKKTEEDYFGATSPSDMRITINTRFERFMEDVEVTLQHEIQHLIQYLEGSNSGASVTYWEDMQKIARARLANNDREIARIYEKYGIDESQEFAFGIEFNPDGTVMEDWLFPEELEKVRKMSDEDLYMYKRASYDNRKWSRIVNGVGPGSLYFNTVGEVEARAASEKTGPETKIRYPDGAVTTEEYSAMTRFSIKQQDMEVSRFMLGLNENNMTTAQEKTMVRQFKELDAALRIERHALNDRTRRLRELEAKQNPTAFDREEMRKLRNRIEINNKKIDRLEGQMIKATSEEGYARLMYQQEQNMRNTVSGRTSEEVRATIETLTKQVTAVTKEIETRQKDIDSMRDDMTFRKTSALVDSSAAEKVAAMIRKMYNSRINKQDLIRAMTEIRLKIAAGKNIDAEAEELAWKILSEATMDGGESLKRLRGTVIKLGKGQVKELLGSNSSLKELRSIFAGSGIQVRSAKDGEIGLDGGSWEELCNIAPELDRNATELEQVNELIRFVQNQKQQMSGAEQYRDNIDEVVMDLKGWIASIGVNTPQDPGAMKILDAMNKLINEMATGIAGSAEKLNTVKAQLAELVDQGKLAISMTDKMQREVEQAIRYNNTLAEQSEAALWKSEKWKLIEQLKSENTQNLLKEQEKWKEKIAKDKQARQMMQDNLQLRKAINTNVIRLKNQLLNAKNNKYIPENMRGVARMLLDQIVTNDLSGRKISGIERKDLVELQRVLYGIDAQEGKYTEADLSEIGDENLRDLMINALDEIKEGIAFYNASTGKDIIANLQAFHNALDRIAEAVADITGAIYAQREAFINGRKILVEDLAYDVMTDAGNSRFKGERTGSTRRFRDALHRAIVSGNMTPEYFFRNIGNKGMSFIWESYHEAENRNGLELRKAQQFFEETAKKHGFKNWDTDQRITLDLMYGGKVDMTLGQLMSLYATWNREQKLGPQMSQHLTLGGFYVEENLDKGIAGRKRLQERAHRVTEEDMNLVEQILTDEQIGRAHV